MGYISQRECSCERRCKSALFWRHEKTWHKICGSFSRSATSNRWWPTTADQQTLSRPSAAEGGAKGRLYRVSWSVTLGHPRCRLASAQRNVPPKKCGFAPAATCSHDCSGSGGAQQDCNSVNVGIVHPTNMRLRRGGSSRNRPPHSKEPTTPSQGSDRCRDAAAAGGARPALTPFITLYAREGADGQAVVCPLLRGSSATRGVAPKQHRGVPADSH